MSECSTALPEPLLTTACPAATTAPAATARTAARPLSAEGGVGMRWAPVRRTGEVTSADAGGVKVEMLFTSDSTVSKSAGKASTESESDDVGKRNE